MMTFARLMLCGSLCCAVALSQGRIAASKQHFAVKALDQTGKDVGTFNVEISCTTAAVGITASLNSQLVTGWVYAKPDQFRNGPWKSTVVRLGASMPRTVNSGEDDALHFVFNGGDIDKDKSGAAFVILLGEQFSGMTSLGLPRELFDAGTFEANTMGKLADGKSSLIHLRFRTDGAELQGFKAPCLDPVQAQTDNAVGQMDAQAKSIAANLTGDDLLRFNQNIDQYKQAAARADERAASAIVATLRVFFRNTEHTRCGQGDKAACAAQDAWPDFSAAMPAYFNAVAPRQARPAPSRRLMPGRR